MARWRWFPIGDFLKCPLALPTGAGDEGAGRAPRAIEITRSQIRRPRDSAGPWEPRDVRWGLVGEQGAFRILQRNTARLYDGPSPGRRTDLRPEEPAPRLPRRPSGGLSLMVKV